MKAPVETAPEPLAALQARYPACLEFTYDQRQIVETGGVRWADFLGATLTRDEPVASPNEKAEEPS